MYSIFLIVLAGFVVALPVLPYPGANNAGYLNAPVVPAPSPSNTVTYNIAQPASIPAYTTVKTSISHSSNGSPLSTSHPIHPLTISPSSVPTTSIVPQPSSSVSLPPPLLSSPTPNASPQTQPSPSSSQNLPISSVFHPDLPASVSPVSGAMPASLPASNPTMAPTVRYVLIAVLVGVPILTFFGFLITMHWRRARRTRRSSEPKAFPETTGVGNAAARERRSARISSFFGVGNGNANGYQEKGKENDKRQLYATSIHSTAGIAGVGAHRGGRENGVPPMIQYVRIPESYKGQEANIQMNFDNPFGTPPPVDGGFFIAPSRVSPRIPPTPPLQLVDLPSAVQNNPRDVQNTERNSTPKLIMDEGASREEFSAPFQPVQSLHDQVNQDKRAPPMPVQSGSIPPSSDRAGLFPHPSGKTLVCDPSPSHPGRPTRASVSVSVYGGMASPHGLGLTTTDLSPALPYRFSNPINEQSPVLPYLASSGVDRPQAQEQRQGMGPIIVIEPASTVDSMSEYDEETEDERGKSTLKEEGDIYSTTAAPDSARREGLIGLPAGYVPPSATFSTVSSYSISSVYGAAPSASPSVSSADAHRYSDPVMFASSSDDSDVTVRAAPAQSRQSRREDGTEITPRNSAISWLPENFDELDKGRE